MSQSCVFLGLRSFGLVVGVMDGCEESGRVGEQDGCWAVLAVGKSRSRSCTSLQWLLGDGAFRSGGGGGMGLL